MQPYNQHVHLHATEHHCATTEDPLQNLFCAEDSWQQGSGELIDHLSTLIWDLAKLGVRLQFVFFIFIIIVSKYKGCVSTLSYKKSLLAQSSLKLVLLPSLSLSPPALPREGRAGGMGEVQRGLLSLGRAQGPCANRGSVTWKWLDLHRGQSGRFIVNSAKLQQGVVVTVEGLRPQLPSTCWSHNLRSWFGTYHTMPGC